MKSSKRLKKALGLGLERKALAMAIMRRPAHTQQEIIAKVRKALDKIEEAA